MVILLMIKYVHGKHCSMLLGIITQPLASRGIECVRSSKLYVISIGD